MAGIRNPSRNEIRQPIEDEREILDNGVPGVDSAIAKRPILGSYLPIHPVDRFTNKKWDLGDWARHNENKYFQAQRDRDRSTTTRNEAKELIDATNTRTNHTQNEVTERLGGRVQDISYWKFELERTIADLSSENDLMVQEIRRLENAIHATEVPTMIAKDCLANRQRRIDTDLVQDNTEKKLLQELEIISSIKSTLTECLNNARDQLTASREAKHNLEMDWSDKLRAHQLDTKNTSLKNTRGNIMHKPGGAKYQDLESLPPQWHDFSPENIRVAKQEAEASNRLRGMISSTLSQTSADMREQADRVEEALNRRLSETEEATRALEDELKATVEEITHLETTIVNLRDAKWEKNAPFCVAETRLGNRHQRPNIEMCRDEPSHRLIEEVGELEDTIRKLELKSEESEDRLRDLQHTRMALEKEINTKRNTIQYDRERVQKVRALFPSTNLLCGYKKGTGHLHHDAGGYAIHTNTFEH